MKVENEAILRGFDMAVPDVGDQLHFRQPLLSFGENSTLYVARRVDWQADRQALAIVDDPKDLELATLFRDDVRWHIASGEGVAVAGAEFFQAASRVGFRMDGFSDLSATDHEYSIRVATPTEFEALESELIDKSRGVFDQELGEAIRLQSRLTERGNAAMLILRRCGPLRQEDLAIRQLAAARQNRDFDLYRRLLARFELELAEPEDYLREQAEQHGLRTRSWLDESKSHLHKQTERHIEQPVALEGTLAVAEHARAEGIASGRDIDCDRASEIQGGNSAFRRSVGQLA